MSSLDEQIDAFLALADKGALTPRVPAMALELLRAVQAARRPVAVEPGKAEPCVLCGGTGFTGSGDRTMECHPCNGTGMVAATPSVGGAEGWQPIETAPKDGSHFLAYEPTGDMYRAAYGRDDVLHAFCGQPVVYSPEPTHWMPVPVSPTPSSSGGRA